MWKLIRDAYCLFLNNYKTRNTEWSFKNNVAPSSITSTGTSEVPSNNDLKQDTIQNILEDISETTSNKITEVHQQTNQEVRNSQNSLRNHLYVYPLTKKDIMYARVLGENPEEIFICQPVNDSTQEVAPEKLSSVYGVECVQILDGIAFKDDDIE